jgi:aromatic-L-amino-acid/L-tryptophan decarboxylase
MSKLLLDAATRRAVLARAGELIDRYLEAVPGMRVTPRAEPAEVRAHVEALSFDRPVSPEQALAHLADGLDRYQVHTPHPRYFGLFNPAPATVSIAADALVAAYNPQMATWTHSPMGVEVERYLLRALGGRFGYPADQVDGTFCSGGAEANHTAVQVALHTAFPEVGVEGLAGLGARPVLYASAEAHHSLHKAARVSGLGEAAVRAVAVDDHLRMQPAALAQMIRDDRAAGLAPFLVVGTAGTTSAGIIDPLAELAGVAAAEGLWYHVDAAWGGAAALIPELAACLAGIERADSITLDAHKWLSVPMGAGLFITRRAGALARAFATRTAYMPRPVPGAPDPYAHSLQWSRRFIGAKLYLALAVAGWEGYAEALRHQVAMGDRLRRCLPSRRWRVVNDTPLPIVCFVDPELDGRRLGMIAARVQDQGRAWLSSTRLAGATTVLRACITNAGSGPGDLDRLITELDRARANLGGGKP